MTVLTRISTNARSRTTAALVASLGLVACSGESSEPSAPQPFSPGNESVVAPAGDEEAGLDSEGAGAAEPSGAAETPDGLSPPAEEGTGPTGTAETELPDPETEIDTRPTGGASAAAVCPQGVTFGDPLAGVSGSDIQTFGPGPEIIFFAYLEGPVWVGDSVYFSDNASGPERIFKLTPPSTEITLFMASSGSNGLGVDGDDQLLLADQRDNRITRVDPQTGEVTGIAMPSGDARPNDLIARSDGSIYFTDPSQGLFHLDGAGNVAGPINESNSPAPLSDANGVVLSLDETRLYVGSVHNNSVSSFALNEDASINADSGALFATTTAGIVDGMALDCAGNLYVATAGGVEVYSPDGQPLGVVPTGSSTNCTFGGADRQTLFVTSPAQLQAVRLGVPGLPN